jgi:hypothetical protein
MQQTQGIKQEQEEQTASSTLHSTHCYPAEDVHIEVP